MSYQFHSDNLPAYRTEFDKLPNETSDEDLDQKLTILSLENCENEEVTLLPCGSQNEKYFCQFHVSTFQGQDLCRPAASTIFGFRLFRSDSNFFLGTPVAPTSTPKVLWQGLRYNF
jgi:hypothetical protein